MRRDANAPMTDKWAIARSVRSIPVVCLPSAPITTSASSLSPPLRTTARPPSASSTAMTGQPSLNVAPRSLTASTITRCRSARCRGHRLNLPSQRRLEGARTANLRIAIFFLVLVRWHFGKERSVSVVSCAGSIGYGAAIRQQRLVHA